MEKNPKYYGPLNKRKPQQSMALIQPSFAMLDITFPFLNADGRMGGQLRTRTQERFARGFISNIPTSTLKISDEGVRGWKSLAFGVRNICIMLTNATTRRPKKSCIHGT